MTDQHIVSSFTDDMNELLANKPTYDGGVERSSKKKQKVKVNLKDSDIVIKKPKSKKSKEVVQEVVQEVESETVNEIVEPVVIEKEVKPKTKKPRSEKQIAAFEALRQRQMLKKEENLSQ